MAPLRDTVGLVYNEEADTGTPEREDELEGSESLGATRSSPPRSYPPLHLPALLGRESRVKRVRDRALKQGVDLVFHQ